MLNKITDILFKYQNYLIGFAIFLSLSAVSVTINQGRITLNLQNYPLLIILLVVLSILCVLIYIKIDQGKIAALSNQIKIESNHKTAEFNILLSELTTRQREVYDLILSGKSNKEIMSHLFIEQSTLKTHINQIYKKLNIKNRKELKSRILEP